MVGPFDCEDIFLIAEDFEDFGEEVLVEFFEAVEVEVVEVLGGVDRVFAVVGVGGAFDFVGVEAKLLGDFFDEGGFAGAYSAVEMDLAAVFDYFADLFVH